MVSAYDKACKAGIVHPHKVSRMKASVSSYLS
jgi:ribosomal protein S20